MHRPEESDKANEAGIWRKNVSQAGGIVRAKALRHKCSLCLKKKPV